MMMKTLAIIGLLLLASTALAQPDRVEAEKAYKYGQALYVKEDYEGAAKQFKAAYDLDPDPVYLFNIAQAYRLGERCKDAGDYYRRYLDAAARAPNEDAVKAYIIEVDACAKKQVPLVVDRPQVEAPETVLDPQPAPIVDAPPRSKKRVAGYIVTGGGVIAAGVGFYSMTRISALEQDASDICNPCTTWGDEEQRERERIDDKAALHEKLMIGSFIAGGAAIAAGVYLIVTGGEQRESSVAITPTRHGAIVSLSF